MAKILNSVGNKIAFNHRHLATIGTGVEVVVEDGYKLCFSLTNQLASKGMIAVNAPGNVKSGPIMIVLLNCGREIVEVKDGDTIAEVWLEQDWQFVWEAH